MFYSKDNTFFLSRERIDRFYKNLVGFYVNNGIIQEERKTERIMKMYYVYILLCSDNTLYIGSTNNLIKRVKAHNTGKGARYTRSRRPVKLLYWEKYINKSQALKREALLKQWRRSDKLALLEEKSAWLKEVN